MNKLERIELYAERAKQNLKHSTARWYDHNKEEYDYALAELNKARAEEQLRELDELFIGACL